MGGSSGIGFATAARLAANGVGVVCWSRRGRAEGQESSEGVGRVEHCAVDVRDPRSVATALTELAARDVCPAAVVYSAGVARWSRVRELTVEDWRTTFDTNVAGAYHVLSSFRAAYEVDPDVVIGICSDAALFPAAGRSAYHSSKAALQAFLESYRLEVRGAGTRVTILNVGKVDTGFSLRTPLDAATAMSAQAVAAVVEWLISVPANIELRVVEMSSLTAPFRGQG